MKNIFKEFLSLSDDDKDNLWSNGIFVFDTNVLLNLYRYSLKTRKALLTALESLKDRIWLPYHVVEEYHKRRCEIIFETVDKYEKFTKVSEKFVEECRNTFKLDAEIVELRDYIKKWLATVKKDNLLISNPAKDEILETLLNLFDGKVGMKIEQSDLDSIMIEGKGRYDSKIPPGYMDAKKINGLYDNNMFGDLIIWKEILEYSKKFGKDIIYVTNDQKEDWWYIIQGKTIGPRYELKKEFYDFTGREFHMYSMNGFLEKTNMNTDISILEELKRVEDDINPSLAIEIMNKMRISGAAQKYLEKYSQEYDDSEVVLFRKMNKLQQQEATLAQLENKYKNEITPWDITMEMNSIKNSIKNTIEEIIYLEEIILKRKIEQKNWHKKDIIIPRKLLD